MASRSSTRIAEDRDIGMAFQNYALYPHMTAFDNIATPLRSRHVQGGGSRARG